MTPFVVRTTRGFFCVNQQTSGEQSEREMLWHFESADSP